MEIKAQSVGGTRDFLTCCSKGRANAWPVPYLLTFTSDTLHHDYYGKYAGSINPDTLDQLKMRTVIRYPVEGLGWFLNMTCATIEAEEVFTP
jgi:hypothetical protein